MKSDPELIAMKLISAKLNELSLKANERILNYFVDWHNVRVKRERESVAKLNEVTRPERAQKEQA